MGKISWLHISDLHFGSSDDGHRGQIRESLLRFIEKRKPNVDYLFISGDLIFAKELNTEEKRIKAYRDAYEYINQLYLKIWNESSTDRIWERVFIVPGNHDVIRNASRITNINGIKSNYAEKGFESIDESYEDSFSSGLKSYLTNFPNDKKENRPESCSATHYVIKTEKINILHINSCISSGKDNEDGTLILGSMLLEKALQDIDTNKPTIAISHHNIDCLDKQEQKKVEILLKKHNVYLLLCGHTHLRESNIILRYNQRKALNTFTAGTLMINGKCDAVIMQGDLDPDTNGGVITSYKWTEDHLGWTEDSEFGLAQSDAPSNKRYFSSEGLSGSYSTTIKENKRDDIPNGVDSIIVPHISQKRGDAFKAVNEKASSSLFVYGIGITHVSKNKDLMNKILKSGGSIKLCMMDPSVFKKEKCKNLIIDKQSISSMHIKIENCNLEQLNFCIGASHMDAYIRDEYADDVQKSYERIMNYKKTIANKGWDLQIKLLRSFVPISINIVNDDRDDAELIAEYNMPFVEKRLLLQIQKEQNLEYYTQLVEVFDAIWKQSNEVSDESRQ